MSQKEEQEEECFISLRDWILSNGGYIHPSLSLQVTSTINARGIVASDAIQEGELLIKLPQELAISGEGLSETYTKNQATNSHGDDDCNTSTLSMSDRSIEITASPWLRCITALLCSYTYQAANEKNNGNGKICSETEESKAESGSELKVNFDPYIHSLPTEYDTLLHQASWTNAQISNFLSGTSLGKMVSVDRESNALRTRYEQSVQPYLQLNNIFPMRSENNEQARDGEEVKAGKNDHNDDSHNCNDEYFYKLFQKACACISTRGFHLRDNGRNEQRQNNKTTTTTPYSGPFLLPFIDLLNHSSSSTIKCTTLQRGKYSHHYPKNHKCYHNIHINVNKEQEQLFNNESFYMIAERPIKKGEEILHSYGNNLTSAQLLQTFGFIEDKHIQRAVKLSSSVLFKDVNSSIKNDHQYTEEDMNTLTPVILSKIDVIKACSLVSSSSYPDELKQKVISSSFQKNRCDEHQKMCNDDDEEDIDEVWDLPINIQCREKDICNIISDELLLHYEGGGKDRLQDVDILSDELITLCCIQFLPDDAYAELKEAFVNSEGNHEQSLCLLTKDILQDYFLGKLVLKSILYAIDQKLDEYNPIDNNLMDGQENSDESITKKVGKRGSRSNSHDNIAIMNRRSMDSVLLCELLENNSNDYDIICQHAIYGLTIRIEEQSILLLLRRLVLDIFHSLDDDVSNYCGDSTSDVKRIRLDP